MPGFLATYADRRLATILALGFSSGLPLFLTSKTLQVWLTEAHADKSTIGYAALIGLPYTLKFLWAPLVDAIAPGLGRRRGWLLITQVAVVAALVALSLQDPSTNLHGVILAAIAVAFASATQDIVVDAYRIEAVEPERHGAAAATGILGYRLGMLVAGSLALILADSLSWHQVYLVMAGGMTIGIAATVLAREPVVSVRPTTFAAAVVDPFRDWFSRQPWGIALVVLGFVCIYKLDDALAQNLVSTFLLEHGYAKQEIGAVQGGLGLVATIVGALIGGAVVGRIGVNRALWVLGAFQALGVLAYAWLATTPVSLPASPDHGLALVRLTMAVCIENLGAGLGTAAFIAFLMGRCNPAYSATQFALLSSLMGTGRTLLASPAGYLVEHFRLTWPEFFLVAAATGIPGLVLLWWVAPWRVTADGSTPDQPPRNT